MSDKEPKFTIEEWAIALGAEEGVTHVTTNYDLFKLISSNRDITKLERLEQAMRKKNLLPCYPIVVNQQMQVLDGQHRLAVAKKLKVPVNFIINSDIELQDVPMANMCVRKWTFADYLKHYKKNGVKSYIQLDTLVCLFPWTTVTSVLHLTGENKFKRFSQGEYQGHRLEFAIQVLSLAERLKPLVGKEYKKRNVLISLSRMVKDPRFDLDTLVKKLEYVGNRFRARATAQETHEELVALYNYRTRKQNQIKI